MPRLSIAIDLDDVLAAHAEAVISFSNMHYSTQLTIEDYNDHWAAMWKVSQDESYRRSIALHDPKFVEAFSVKQVEVAKQTLEKMQASYDLYIVTARAVELIPITRAWVGQHFPGIFRDIHFVPIWDPNNTLTKADICTQIGANYLIDDLAKHCNIAASQGIQAILFGDYAWNRAEAITDGVTRCRDWHDVIAFFSKIPSSKASTPVS